MRSKRLLVVLLFSIITLAACTIGANAGNIIRIYVDGIEISTDVQPQIIDGRVMVPIRAVAQAVGCSVEWDGSNVFITSQSAPSMSVAPIISQPDLSLLELASQPQLISMGSTHYVVGYVKNNSNYTYDFVNLEVKYLDSRGNTVTTVFSKVNGLKPGEVSKFVAQPVTDSRVVKAYITIVGGN